MLIKIHEKNLKQKFILFSIFIIFCNVVEGQNTVGIGTKEPNPHAVLDLTAPNGNQGFFVPRLSMDQRLAPGFISGLSSADNGLLVFDLNLKKFFYWNYNRWEEINTPLSAGAKGDKGDKGDKGEKGDKGDPAVGLIQTLAATKSGSTIDLGISSGNSISLNVDDSDPNPTNEIQELQLNGNVLALTKSTSTSGIDLTTVFKDNQNLTFDSATKQLSIQNGNSVDLNITDADADATNEIQDLQLNGKVLKISQNPLATSIDLTSIDSDQQTLNYNASTGVLSIQNGNAVTLGSFNNTNAVISQLNLSGNVLQITEGASTHSLDLSSLNNKTLAEANIFVGNSSGEATPRVISGDATIASTGVLTVANDRITTNKIANLAVTDAKISSLSPSKLTKEGAENGQYLGWSDSENKWVPSTFSAPFVGEQYHSIDALNFISTGKNKGDIFYYGNDASFVFLKEYSDQTNLGAPINLPQGAKISEVIIYFHDSEDNGSRQDLKFRVLRKGLAGQAQTEIYSGSSSGSGGDSALSIPLNLTVDNQNYSYRIMIEMNKYSYDDSTSSIKQRIYSARIKYTF